MNGAQRFVHSAMLGAESQKQDTRLAYYGHISTYDPDKGACKVIIPVLRDPLSGTPLETNWIQLGTFMAGNGFGFQFHPIGGATAEEPEKGEQVRLICHNRQSGLFTIDAMFFNSTMLPPGGGAQGTEEEEQEEDESAIGNDDDPDLRKLLNPGEFLFKHPSGSGLKFYEDGKVQLICTETLDIYSKQETNIVVREGDLNATVDKGDANIKATKGDINATADEGDVNVEATLGNVALKSQAGSITAETTEGNIEASTQSGAVNVHAGADVSVEALGIITLTAPSIIASLNPEDAQALCNLAFLEVFNGHTHETGMGVTGPPVPQAEPGLTTTINFLAG